jgi:competence protein ComEA
MPSCDAYSITGYRNRNGQFVAVEELLEVKQISPWKYDRYKDRVAIVDGEAMFAPEGKPVAVENGEVNVNVATAEEIHTATGMSMQTAQAIVGYRNTHGLYAKLEDLLNAPRFGNGCMKTYGGMLTVGAPVVDEEDEEETEEQSKSGKVNINLANIYDLMKVGFEKRAAALIVNERKKYGNYRSVDELSEIDEISGKILRKLRDKLEV